MRFILLAFGALLIAFAALVVGLGLWLWFTPDPEGGRRWFAKLMFGLGGAAGALGLALAFLARRRDRQPVSQAASKAG